MQSFYSVYCIVLLGSKKKGRSIGTQFSYHELVLTHHKVMLASLGLLDRRKDGLINVLIVGLGGGALSMFTKTQIPMVRGIVLLIIIILTTFYM